MRRQVIRCADSDAHICQAALDEHIRLYGQYCPLKREVTYTIKDGERKRWVKIRTTDKSYVARIDY